MFVHDRNVKGISPLEIASFSDRKEIMLLFVKWLRGNLGIFHALAIFVHALASFLSHHFSFRDITFSFYSVSLE